MRFNSDYEYLFVEGIQFSNGLYETDKEEEIAILHRYPEVVKVLAEEDKTSTPKTKAKKGDK